MSSPMQLIFGRLICALFCLALPLTSRAEDSAPPAQERQVLMSDLLQKHQAFTQQSNSLAKLVNTPKEKLSKAQQAKREELMETQDQFLASLKAAKAVMKKGDSVSSYPGLLALGKITYSSGNKIYLLEIPVGYLPYEDSTTLHPYFHYIRFDLEGRILEHELAGSMATS